MTFQKCRLLIFFKMTFFRKIKKNQECLSQDQTVWLQIRSDVSDFIWQFLTPYMGVIPNPKMAFFPILCILVLIFPFFIIYFPKCEGKGSFLKFQINSHFCGILCVLTLYSLNGFLILIRCINFGMVHYIYRGVTAYNFKIKLHFFL